ncbi:MAG: AmmeMemoRadiSam system radical SAM enzyme [Thaumarchaeota archaeon]|nr:AmmeMemoRadiSam system radical SAM enzyme [Nitrososphaerota archaeon]
MANAVQKNIEDIIPGDSLWSYETENGFKIVPSTVTHTGTRIAETYEARYGNRGEGSFCATVEHPVLTKSGWKEVGQLREGDEILKVWYQNTPEWRAKRYDSIKDSTFTCGVCGTAIVGFSAWNIHRGKCYTRELVWTAQHMASVRRRMLTNNPMKDATVARKVSETNKARFLADPTHPWHLNVGRLQGWLHRHPSESQKMLYKILDEADIKYQPEYRIKTEQKTEGSKSYHIADAAILESKLDIEIDGWWHYNSQEVAQNDAIRDRTLQLNGWNVLRISGSKVHNHPEEVKALIIERISPVIRRNKRAWLGVKSVKPTGWFEQVYSLECIPNHNYVADGILVHNCQYCQNYDISQRRKIEGVDVTPEAVVEMAVTRGCQGIAYTYNEPTIFIEFARDIGVEAHKRGIFNIFVSNGYGTPEAVSLVKNFLDCITVDFKGSGERSFVRRYINIPSADPIYEYILDLRDKTQVHIEITDLIVPQIGDDLGAAEKLCRWVYDNLGPDTPIHFLRFHPDYRLMHLPWTPIETLEKHHQIAKKAGLRFAYLGNIPGHPLEHTYCPGCSKIVVERYGFDIAGWHLDSHNRCETCGHPIPIYGNLSNTVRENRFLPVL